MTVINKNEQKCQFKDIKSGEVFRVDKLYFIKTKATTNNAIDLATGEPYGLLPDNEVVYGDCKLYTTF